MIQPPDNIKEQLKEKLANYLIKKSEDSLTAAYELGRSAANAGIGGLEMVCFYHEALLELNPGLVDEEMRIVLESSLEFLTECLVPYEIQQTGFQDLIQQQEIQNQLLQEEIHRRKNLEEELRASKEHFRHLIENALDIITMHDSSGIIQYESPSLKRILGYDSEEIIGENVFNYIHRDDVERVKQNFAAVVTSPGKTNSAEFRIKHKKGYWIYLESIAKYVYDEIKKHPALIVNSRDVTGKVKAWEKIKQREKQLSAAQQIGRLGSWEWNVEKNVFSWSDELCRIFGIIPESRSYTYGETYEGFLRHVHPDFRKKTADAIKNALEKNQNFEFDQNIIRSDGSIKNLFVRGEVITDENGKPVKIIGIGHDITELKAAEKKLKKYSKELRNLTARLENVREEERMRISRELHDDLGQMLTVLRMEIFILINETKKKFNERFVSGFSKDIDKIINRIDTIVQSVQRLTTELRPEELDEIGLAETLEWYAREIEMKSSLQVRFTNSASAAANQLDKNRSTAIFRIFQETLTNTIKHAHASTVNILLDNDEHQLILTIEDDGIGISQQEIESSNSVGIIGMRERCLFLGGTLAIDGKPGKGTKVVLNIALQSDEPNNN